MAALQFLTFLTIAWALDEPNCEQKGIHLQTEEGTSLGTATIHYKPQSKQLCLQHSLDHANVGIFFNVHSDFQQDSNQDDRWIPSAATNRVQEDKQSESCIILSELACKQKVVINLRAKVVINGQAWYKSLKETTYAACCSSSQTIASTPSSCDFRNCSAVCRTTVAIRAIFIKVDFQINNPEVVTAGKDNEKKHATRSMKQGAGEDFSRPNTNNRLEEALEAARIISKSFQYLSCCPRVLQVAPGNATKYHKINNNDKNHRTHHVYEATIAFLPFPPYTRSCPYSTLPAIPTSKLPSDLSIIATREVTDHEDIRNYTIKLVNALEAESEVVEEKEGAEPKGGNGGKKKVGIARWIGLMYVLSVTVLGITLGVAWCLRVRERQLVNFDAGAGTP